MTGSSIQLDSMEHLAPQDPGEVRFGRSYSLPCSPEQAWSYFSHTDWLNRAIGLPPVHYSTYRAASGELIVEGEAPFFRGKLRWREHPFQWLRPVVCGVQRDFLNGPLARFRGGFDITPEKGNACLVRFLTAITPKSDLGKFMIASVIGPTSLVKLDRAVERVRKLILAGADSGPLSEVPPLNVTPPDSLALKAGLERLQLTGEFSADLLHKLSILIESMDDVEATRLRPFVVAQRWGIPKWDAVRFFLHATRAGLLDLSWEVLCPSCGEDAKPNSSLGKLREQMHCDSCEVGFGPEFDKSVELKFSTNKAVRNIAMQKFCLGGVNFRQTMVAQVTFPEHSTKMFDWPLEAGRYRLRSDAWDRGVDFSVSSLAPGGEGILRVNWNGSPHPEIESEAFAGEHLQVANTAPVPLTIRLEKVAEADEVLTAREVTNWQEFRDLFSSEVLSPGEQLIVGRQVLLFTDLRGSTELYQSLGDAQAYSRVREHFDILIEVLRAYRGGLVKTIGDAVMAVFSSLPDALNAVFTMHRKLAQFEDERHPEAPLKLKAALHAGPCLMINANGLLDCFGTTVNYAARLLGESSADSVVLSDSLYDSEEAQEFFKNAPHTVSSRVAKLRGFANDQTIWTVRAIRDNP